MHLGVAQLVERYLGVVEAARSSRVTQTRSPKVLYFRTFLFVNIYFGSRISALFILSFHPKHIESLESADRFGWDRSGIGSFFPVTNRFFGEYLRENIPV